MLSIRNAEARARAEMQEAFPDEHIDVLYKEISLLLSHCTGLSREQLLVKREDVLATEESEEFFSLLKRRIAHEPLAYILGTQEFYSLEFSVGPEVLIPRKETELIVDRVLELFVQNTFPRVVDIGCGSGAIILSIASELRKRLEPEVFEKIEFEALDISSQACKRASENARALDLEGIVSVDTSDLLGNWKNRESRTETIFVSNPPYVADSEVLDRSVLDYEPELALRAGPEGLDVIKDLFTQVKGYIEKSPASLLLVEIGIGQWAKVECLARENGLSHCEFHEDLQGIKRVVEVGLIERNTLHNGR